MPQIFLAACRRQFDVVFMLDLSGSVQAEYERTIAFTKRVIYGLDMSFDRTRFGVVTFGDTATIQFDLNAYRYTLMTLPYQYFIFSTNKLHIITLHRLVFSFNEGPFEQFLM